MKFQIMGLDPHFLIQFNAISNEKPIDLLVNIIFNQFEFQST